MEGMAPIIIPVSGLHTSKHVITHQPRGLPPMTIHKRRAFQYALVVLCVCTFINPVGAQHERLRPAAIGQIVDAALRQVIAPTDSLSRVSVAKRKVFFDHERTIGAFGYFGGSTPLSALGLRSAVTKGSRTLLNDCDQWGEKPCKELGWRVYAWVEPVSVTESQAVVRVHASWLELDPKTFKEGTSPRVPGFLTSMIREVHLARSGNGDWKFVKEGPAMAG